MVTDSEIQTFSVAVKPGSGHWEKHSLTERTVKKVRENRILLIWQYRQMSPANTESVVINFHQLAGCIGKIKFPLRERHPTMPH